MKKVIIGLILLCSITAYSQNLEIIGGLNKNKFFNFPQNEGHFTSSYEPGNGYVIRVGLNEIKVDELNFRFTLSYDKYSGELYARDGGLGGGSGTSAKIDKSLISMGVFPINFKIKDKIDFSFGIEVAELISEKFSGTRGGWTVGETSISSELNEVYDNYSSSNYFGLCGRIAYDFIISDKLAISPQYSYYLGLSKEFIEFPEVTKSMRHYFCIGVQRKIK